MGRPALGIGDHGKISSKRVGCRYRAWCRYRDEVGELRTLQRFADTAEEAEEAVRAAVDVRAPSRQIKEFHPQGYFVYLLRDAKGKIVYVGSTSNVLSRVGAHLTDPERRSHVETVDTIRCDDREHMLHTELQLIRRHRPRFNIVGVAS